MSSSSKFADASPSSSSEQMMLEPVPVSSPRRRRKGSIRSRLSGSAKQTFRAGDFEKLVAEAYSIAREANEFERQKGVLAMVDEEDEKRKEEDEKEGEEMATAENAPPPARALPVPAPALPHRSAPAVKDLFVGIELHVLSVSDRDRSASVRGWVHLVFACSEEEAHKLRAPGLSEQRQNGRRISDALDGHTPMRLPSAAEEGAAQSALFHNSSDALLLYAKADAYSAPNGKLHLAHIELAFKATLAQHFDLHAFPFDRQYLTCALRLERDSTVRWNALSHMPAQKGNDWTSLVPLHAKARIGVLTSLGGSPADDGFSPDAGALAGDTANVGFHAVSYVLMPGVIGWFRSKDKVGPPVELVPRPVSGGQRHGGDHSRSSRRVGDPIAIVPLRRKPLYYFWSVVYPLALITTLSVLTFFAESSDYLSEDRLSPTLVLLLSAIAFRTVFAEQLPRVDYLTALDKYSLVALSIIGLVAVQCGAVEGSNLDEDGRHLADLISAYVFAALWGGVNVCAAVYSYVRLWRSEEGWKRARNLALTWMENPSSSNNLTDTGGEWTNGTHEELLRLAEDFERENGGTFDRDVDEHPRTEVLTSVVRLVGLLAKPELDAMAAHLDQYGGTHRANKMRALARDAATRRHDAGAGDKQRDSSDRALAAVAAAVTSGVADAAVPPEQLDDLVKSLAGDGPAATADLVSQSSRERSPAGIMLRRQNTYDALLRENTVKYAFVPAKPVPGPSGVDRLRVVRLLWSTAKLLNNQYKKMHMSLALKALEVAKIYAEPMSSRVVYTKLLLEEHYTRTQCAEGSPERVGCERLYRRVLDLAKEACNLRLDQEFTERIRRSAGDTEYALAALVEQAAWSYQRNVADEVRLRAAVGKVDLHESERVEELLDEINQQQKRRAVTALLADAVMSKRPHRTDAEELALRGIDHLNDIEPRRSYCFETFFTRYKLFARMVEALGPRHRFDHALPTDIAAEPLPPAHGRNASAASSGSDSGSAGRLARSFSTKSGGDPAGGEPDAAWCLTRALLALENADNVLEREQKIARSTKQRANLVERFTRKRLDKVQYSRARLLAKAGLKDLEAAKATAAADKARVLAASALHHFRCSLKVMCAELEGAPSNKGRKESRSYIKTRKEAVVGFVKTLLVFKEHAGDDKRFMDDPDVARCMDGIRSTMGMGGIMIADSLREHGLLQK